MQFEFATATRILFGPGRAAELPTLARGLGQRVFLVTGRTPERTAGLEQAMVAGGLAISAYRVAQEPTVDMVEKATQAARAHEADLVVGIGGGSALDAGKAVAALLANGGAPLDYLEGVGGGRKIEKPSVPYIAVPTTAGTGAEVTRNAVLGSTAHRVKVSMRSAFMLPTLALVDPELTRGLPPAVTASTGLDALTQLMEAFVSVRATPVTDALCREGLPRASRALPRAFHRGDDLDAREDMALASLLSGMALANAGLGAVHGLAGPLGGLFAAPHGAVCARLLPAVMSCNVDAVCARAPDTPARERYDEVACLVTGAPDAEADDGVRWVRRLVAELGVPGLTTYGLRREHVAEVVAKARRASSMKGNPVSLTDEELARVLEEAMDAPAGYCGG